MSLWKIAFRSIQQRALASLLTSISMALGVTLVIAVLVIHAVVGDSFRNNAALGYNMIVGAKGGKLQLVLNTVYYLSSPVENIPYSYYKEFTDGKFKFFTERAVPVCLGDYYQNYRVVGTTSDMFDHLQYGSGRKYEFSSGQNFKPDEFFSGVVGATVAREAGLAVGSQFHPTHGEGGHEHDPFTVVGVLAPTGTPNDRALFVNIEGFYMLDDHAKVVEVKPVENQPSEAQPESKPADDTAKHDDHDHADEDHVHADDIGAEAEHDHAAHRPLPEDQREVTAILVRTSSDMYTPSLRTAINEGPVAQSVLPILEITRLFQSIVDPLQMVLLGLTITIVLVSGISILVSIYNSMSDRRHEIAVMRALGARRRTVMTVVLLESILLSLAGGVLGWLLGHTLIAALSPWITAETGVSVGFFQLLTYRWVIMEGSVVVPIPYEAAIILGLIGLASLVGYLPALTAYRTDVAKALSSTP